MTEEELKQEGMTWDLCPANPLDPGIAERASERRLEDPSDNEAPEGFQCPVCGERSIDCLTYDDWNYIHCESCGSVYADEPVDGKLPFIKGHNLTERNDMHP